MIENPGVKVTYGVHEVLADAIGKSVQDVRVSSGQILNLPPDAYPVISGKRVSEDHVIQKGQEIEFIKEAGIKGYNRFTPDRYPDLIFDEAGRVRVRIEQAEGQPIQVGPWVTTAADPPQAKANMHKEGWCEEDAPHPGLGTNPKITLDDGTVIWGYQCWWAPVKKGEAN